MQTINCNQLLPVQGAANLRDLGGYPCTDGRYTKKNSFFRSDDTSRLTETDITLLKNLGLSLIVDLRSSGETDEKPSVFKNDSDMNYQHVSMLDNINSATAKDTLPSSMYDLYIHLLSDSKDAFAKVFRLFSNKQGACLFNCAIGKDRTGMTAMLLLDLCGVHDEVIISDYAQTEKNLASQFALYLEAAAKKGITIPKELLSSSPETMKKTLLYLRKTYSSAREYLLNAGSTEQELHRVIEGFVE